MLKWAHVYEVAEPYHTEALWAAEEIKKRTDGKYEIQVFPASQLGNEPQINEALGLGTVDIIYTGAAFVGGVHKPLSISNCPYIFRNFDHWKAYRGSTLFRGLADGYEQEDRPPHRRPDLLRRAASDLQQGDQGAGRPQGHEAARAAGAAVRAVRRIYGANATPIAFAEVYLALQQGTVDGQENPLPTIMAKKFYEVQKYIHLTGHITESLVTALGQPMLGKLSDAEKDMFAEVLDAGRRQGHRRHPRERAEAAGRVREARQDRHAPRPRGVPQGRGPRAPRARGARVLDQGALRPAAGADVGRDSAPRDRDRRRARQRARVSPLGRCAIQSHARMTHPARPTPRAEEGRNVARIGTEADGSEHLIQVEDAEVEIEHHPEDWLAFAIFWALAAHRLPAVLHALRPQRQRRLDRGDRALRPDLGHLHRRRHGDAPQHATSP